MLFYFLNNSNFQKKIITNYLSENQIKEDTYFTIDNFDYNFFSGDFRSDIYLITEKPILDTILSLHSLNFKIGLLDILFSNNLNLDFLKINNPDIYVSQSNNGDVPNMNTIYTELSRITNTIQIQDFKINNLFLSNSNGYILEDVDISISNLSFGPSFIVAESTLLTQGNSFIKFDISILDQKTSMHITESYIDSTIHNSILLSDLALNGTLNLNQDSIYLDASVNYAGGFANGSYIETRDTIYWDVNGSGFEISHLKSFLDTLNIPIIEPTLFNFNFSNYKSDSIILSSSFFTDYGQVNLNIEFDSLKLFPFINLDYSNFHVKLKDFNLGAYLKYKNIGVINSDVYFNYNHQYKELQNINLKTSSFSFNNYTYRNILLKSPSITLKKGSSYDLNFYINDRNLKSRGNFVFNKNEIYKSMTISYLDLNNLNFNVNDSLSFMSANFQASMNTNFLNLLLNSSNQKDLQIANFSIKDLVYHNKDSVELESILLSVNSSGECQFSSPIGIVDFSISKGDNQNKKSTYETLFNSFFNNNVYGNIYISSCQANFNRASTISDIFFDNINLHDSLEISYNSQSDASKFQCLINTPSIVLKKISFDDVHFLVNDNDQAFRMSAKYVNYLNNIFFKNINFSAIMHDFNQGRGAYELNFLSSNNNKSNIKGNFQEYEEFLHLSINDTSFFNISDKKWVLDAESVFAMNKKNISLNNVSVYRDSQSMMLNGSIGKNSNLAFSFKNFDVDNINPFIVNPALVFGGLLNGKVLFNPEKFPVFSGDFNVDNFSFNHNYLGELSFKNYSNEKNDSLYIIGEIYKDDFFSRLLPNAKAERVVYFLTKYPFDGSRNITTNLTFKSLPLGVLDPFIKPIKQLDGRTSGTLNIKGDIKNYEIYGSCKSKEVNFSIPYLGASFVHKDDTLVTYFNGDEITFNRFNFYDTQHQTEGFFDGKLIHSALKNIKYNLAIKSDSLSALKTDKYSNEAYYGNVFLGGDLKIKGDSSSVFLDIDGVAKNGSELMIPLSDTKDIKENKFIKFSNDSSYVKAGTKSTNNKARFNMNFNLDIDNQSEIQLVFDEEIGDLIKVHGDGDLYLKIIDSDKLNIFGDFNIEKGSYLFTLQDVIAKNFEIERGGLIEFNGDPYNAKINFNLLYHTKASLNPLNSNYDRDKKSAVLCGMEMSGDLLSPDIKFYIDIPNADQITETSLETLTNTDQKLFQQFLYLLITNSFLIEDDPDVDYVGNTLTTTGTELLSSQLSNWLSKTTDVVDLGFKWIPATGDSLSNQQIELVVSKKFLDDRVVINGNVGTPPEQSESNIVSDVDIEYDLFKDGRLKLKVFNRTEDYDPLSETPGYEQGVGVFFKKQFNSFKELFKNNKKDKE